MKVYLETITPAQARELTDRIKTGVEAIWELIKQAYVERAWDSLGYSSWDDYCTREFGTSRIKLPREERHEVVASMRELGMSVRAIASATGTGKDTVARELRSGVANETPAPVTGTDGKTYRTATVRHGAEHLGPGEEIPITHESTINTDTGEVLSERRLTEEVAPGITAGELDALNIPKQSKEPEQPRRKALNDTYWSAVIEARRALERITKLHHDDRFAKQKGQIADANLADLTRIANDLNEVITELKEG